MNWLGKFPDDPFITPTGSSRRRRPSKRSPARRPAPVPRSSPGWAARTTPATPPSTSSLHQRARERARPALGPSAGHPGGPGDRALNDDVRGVDGAARLAGAVLGHGIVAVLGRGPARAAAEMGALTLKESGVMAESFATAAFRHGPFELAGPDLAAIVIATEPETRDLDLGLAADLVRAGSSVIVCEPTGAAPDGAIGVPVGSVDRLLGPAVSIVPIQLLAWRLAIERGRTPGAYTLASKVTTRE